MQSDLSLQHNSIGVWEYEPTTETLKFSEYLYELLSIKDKKTEYPVSVLFDSILPQDKTILVESIDKALFSGVPFSVHLRLADRNEYHRWLNITGEKKEDATDKTTKKIVGTIQEITHLKRLEKTNEVIAELGGLLITVEQLETLYKNIHQLLSKIINVKNFFIALLDPGSKTISFPYFIDTHDPPAETIPIDNPISLTAELIRKETSLFYDWKKLQNRFAEENPKKLGTIPKVWVGVPLRVRDTVIGAIVLQCYESSKTYTKEDQKILELISYQVAIAIDRKNTELQLKQNEEILNFITEGASDLVAILDLHGNRIYSSNSYKKIFGTDIELAGTNSFKDIHPDDREKIQNIFRETIETGEGKATEYRFKLPNGSVRFIESRGNLLRDNQGKPFRVIVISRDVTERKKSEEQIREKEHILRQVINYSLDAFITFDQQGTIIDANSQAKSMFGYLFNKQSNIKFADIISAPEDYQSHEKWIDEYLNTKQSKVFHQRLEVEAKDSTGKPFPVELTLTPVYTQKGITFSSSIRDLTEYKEAELQIREFQKDLEKKIEERTSEVMETNRHLQEEIALRKRVERVQQALYQISEAIHTTEHLDSLYEEIHNIISRFMSAKNFYIAIHEKENNLITFPYSVDEFDEYLENRTKAKGLTEYVLDTGKPYLLKEQEVYDLIEKNIVYTLGKPSKVWLGVPLKDNQNCIGVLAVQDYEDETAYTENEKQLLIFISDQIADAILRKQVEENERNRMATILLHRNVLLELAQHDHLDFSQTMKNILRAASYTLNIERASFWSFDNEKTSLFCEMMYKNEIKNIDPDSTGIKHELEADTFAVRSNSYFQALKINKTIRANDVTKHKSLRFIYSYLEENNIKALMDVPVWQHRNVIGILRLEQTECTWNWSYEEEDFAASLATMVSLTFEASQRKSAEESLRASEEKYRLLAENSSDLIELLDFHGNVLYASPSHNTVLGFTQDELISKGITSLLRPEDADKISRLLDDFTEDYSFGTINLLIKTKAGKWLLCETKITPIFNDSGIVDRFLLSARDITERKEAENALGESEEKYRILVENANEAIVVIQNDYIKFANPKTEELFAQNYETLTSSPFSDFVHPEDRAVVRENYKHRIEGKESLDYYSFRIVTPKKQIILIEINAVTIEWMGAPATLNFLNDITERKRAEEEIKKALEKEKELSELRSSFITMASHEFRTPLTSILSSAEILQKYKGKISPEKETKYFSRIRDKVAQMTQILDDVLLLGTAEAGKLNITPEYVDIYLLITKIVEEFEQNSTINTGHKIITITNNLDGSFLIDLKSFKQILDNLLSNAIKYSPDDTQITFEVSYNEGTLFCKVEDQGIGIPEEDISSIFNPFHRAMNTGSITGSGLGLTIVKRAIDMLKGRVEVSSKQNKGTSFKIFLPVTKKQED